MSWPLSRKPSMSYISLTPRSRPSRDIARRFVKWVLFLTVLISSVLIIRIKGYAPGRWTNDKVSYTDKFRLSIPHDLKETVSLWHEEFDTRGSVIIETHAHSKVSDGSLTPEQLVDWAIAYGFDVLCVTDHNNVEGGLQAQKHVEEQDLDLIVIPGVEYSCCRIHMNLIGINETIKPTENFPSDMELQQVIARTHQLGGIVVVNHLPWSLKLEHHRDEPTMQNHPSPYDLIAWGVDMFETVSDNGVVDIRTARLSDAYQLPIIAATDMHDVDTVPKAWTVTRPREMSQREILESLRDANRTSVYYDPTAALPRQYSQENPQYLPWWPINSLDFMYFWDEDSGMYSFVDGFCHERKFVVHWDRIAVFVTWCAALFVAHEVWLVFIKSYKRERPVKLDYLD